ncbi:MAG: TonB-dependent receptor [Alphaproteobacteria bacterium]|nr:TonB-dependent receptor [Alphaproteobacteria bacterium]
MAALALGAQSAAAQEAASATQVAAADEGTEAVTVTGTRVVRNGYNAPTPVTVIGADQIDARAPANLSEFVDQLPALQASTKADTSAGSLSNGLAGVASLNLRGLGANRTLVLLDGHRTPASASTGEIDINTIPQQLVKRVDVVTGGASADYGSDAVGGVVNFILDTDYTGIKGSMQYGETYNALRPNYKTNLTYGGDFLGGKAHLLLSGEWVQIQGIYDYNPKWNQQGFFRVQNPAYTATNGQPFYLIQKGIGASQVSPGGLVINSVTNTGAKSTKLGGTYFGVNGSVNNLAYGTVTGPWMIGGDTAITQANYGGTDSLAAGETRGSLFGRASYYITPDIDLWVEGSVTRYKGRSYYMQPPQVGGITILSDNAFLPQSIRDYMAANNLKSLNMGSTNAGFPKSGSRNGREAQRFALGLDGNTNVLDTDWTWNLFAQASMTNTREQETPLWNNARLAAAQDAVFAPAGNALGVPAGTIVCRSSLTAPTNGCVPLSRIGVNGGMQSATDFQKGLDYVLGTPYRLQRLNEQVYGFNASGNPISTWAGPVSVAFGAEWRLESINGFVEPQYNSGWLFGNYLVTKGHYSVAEGYLETVVPLAEGLDVNGAIRYTAYSTSGGVNTWKLGANYQPIDDIKFRVTYSHDIRAPNLNELFATGTRRTNTVVINNTSYTFVQNLTGNPNLSPEAANSLGLGAVVTPTFIPGLAASVDYFNINIKGSIGTISAQSVTDLCYLQSNAGYCPNIEWSDGIARGPGSVGSAINYINLKPINYATQKWEGIDFDLTYQVPLEDMDWFGEIPGELTLTGLATKYIRAYTNDGISPPTDAAGTNASGGTPDWSYQVAATYHTDPWTFFVLGRGVSAGKYANEWIVCTSGCPTSSLAHRTSILNSIEGAFYVDSSITYDFSAWDTESEVFVSVKNVFNSDPPLVGYGPDGNNTPAYPSTNRSLYDYLGRVYSMGLRFKM